MKREVWGEVWESSGLGWVLRVRLCLGAAVLAL